MKFLFVAGDLSQFGGIEKYNRDFLAAVLKSNIKTILVERRKGGFSSKASFFFRFAAQFIKERPDIIICTHLNFSPICLILKKFFGTPYTIALYGIEAIDVKGVLKRRAICEAERIITISEYTKGFILKQFPGVKDRIFMLPSAVDGSLFFIKNKKKELVEQLNLANKRIILTLARLSTTDYKGQDRVLGALPYVLEKVPDALYLIVGGGKDGRVDVFLKDHPEIAKHVILTGSVADADRVDYYNLGDVFVMPSKFEGFGIVFIESLACGVPVIASDAYGCREGLLNGELGLLVQSDDFKAIADAIIAIFTKHVSSSLLDREYLRARVLDIYGIGAWNTRIAQLINILQSCL